ncbi:hypothetical protein AAG906_022741 [Vitis piasezkii]
MEHLLTPRDFFYPRVAMDFYQSMTTKQVRDPTLIHFTIDGRHGILGARHIAEALHIPYEPSHFEDYRVWTSPSQLEMLFDHQSNPRLRRVIWNPWKSNGKLRNMKNQSFEVLCHKQIRNARRGSKEKSAMNPIYAYYMLIQSLGSHQSNSLNGAQFRAKMKELQLLEAEHRIS